MKLLSISPVDALSFCKKYRVEIFLILISLVLTCIYWLGRPYMLYNDSDPLTYIRKAWWLLGREGGVDSPSRGLGYPIWLIITGFAGNDSWFLLKLSQFVMAILAPLLVYKTIAFFNIKVALISALIFMVFGIPYEMMKWVMTEQLFMFVLYLSFFTLSKFCVDYKNFLPRAVRSIEDQARVKVQVNILVGLLLFLALVKPAGTLLFWSFFAVAIVFMSRIRVEIIKGAAVFSGAMILLVAQSYFYGNLRFPTLYIPETSELRQFSDAFYARAFTTDSDEYSVMAPLVKDKIEHFQRTGLSNAPSKESHDFLYPNGVNSDDLVKRIFDQPNPLYFQTVVGATRQLTDRKLYEYAKSRGYGYVKGFLRYLLGKPSHFIFGPKNSYIGYHFFARFYRVADFHNKGEIGPRDFFAPGYLGATMFNPGNGIASAEIGKFINDYVKYFQIYSDPAKAGEERFGGLDNYVKYMQTFPYPSEFSGSLVGNLFNWMIAWYGEEPAAEKMMKASMEAIKVSPVATTSLLLGDFAASTMFTGINLYSLNRLVLSPSGILEGISEFEKQWFEGTVRSGQPNALPPKLSQSVGHWKGRSDLAETISAIQLFQYDLYKNMKFIMALLMVLTLICSLTSGNPFPIILFTFYLLSAAALTVTNFMPNTDPRHAEVYSFVPLILSAIGIHQILNRRKN